MFDFLSNDIIPYDSFSVKITSYDKGYFRNISYNDDNKSIDATVYKSFFDSLTIVYEVCTPDCNDCVIAKILLSNEEFSDIIGTNTIIPNSSGKNATLRFTDDDVLKDSELYIFNRNGDRIFQMKDYDNSWNADGYPGGIYYYVLRYRGLDIKKTLTVMK